MMRNLDWLLQQRAALRQHLAEAEAQMAADPENFAWKLQLKGKKQHLEQLNSEILVAQAEREKELIEVRLIGNQVQKGSIPLGLLAKITGPLNRWLASAAYHLTHGIDARRGPPDDWVKQLDLRLAGIGQGSSRLFMTGNVSPDLAGDSPLQKALTEVFSLLESQGPIFFEQLHEIGFTAARGMAEFLKVLEAENLAAEIKWTSPNDQDYCWDGKPGEITRVRALLDNAENAEERYEELSGAVALLSESGRIEIRLDGSERKVKVAYRQDQVGFVSRLTLSSHVTLRVLATRYLDPIRDDFVTKYSLAEPNNSEVAV